jgi:hypothetical protein
VRTSRRQSGFASFGGGLLALMALAALLVIALYVIGRHFGWWR